MTSSAASPIYPVHSHWMTEAPMSRKRVLQVLVLTFSLMVALVLLAAYLGYSGSNRIQDTAHELIRESSLPTVRGQQLENLILTETQELLDQLSWVLGLCFLFAAGSAGMAVWIIQRAFTRMEWQSAELARVSWHLLDGHEKLARRFSHEMHDELGQALSGLRRMLSRVSPADFPAMRAECVLIVDEVLQNVRKLSQVLRPVILDDLGLDSGLRWLCERYSRRMNIPVAYTSNWTDRLAEEEETHLFRIAQEALTNIARHSGASSASVDLSVGEERVRLEISDNGHGIIIPAGSRNPSLGMVGMRARARQLGGELIVDNRKEGGLRIVIDVPLRPVNTNGDQQENQGVAG